MLRQDHCGNMEFTFDLSELRGLPGVDRLAGFEVGALVRELKVQIGFLVPWNGSDLLKLF